MEEHNVETIWTPYHGLIDVAKAAHEIDDVEIKQELIAVVKALTLMLQDQLKIETSTGANIANFPHAIN